MGVDVKISVSYICTDVKRAFETKTPREQRQAAAVPWTKNFLHSAVQPGERAAWDAGAEAAEQAEADAAEALSAIAGLESRVSRVEDGLFNNITGNPFLVQFDSLDGVVMTKGIWNAARNRIEC